MAGSQPTSQHPQSMCAVFHHLQWFQASDEKGAGLIIALPRLQMASKCASLLRGQACSPVGPMQKPPVYAFSGIGT